MVKACKGRSRERCDSRISIFFLSRVGTGVAVIFHKQLVLRRLQHKPEQHKPGELL